MGYHCTQTLEELNNISSCKQCKPAPAFQRCYAYMTTLDTKSNYTKKYERKSADSNVNPLDQRKKLIKRSYNNS